MIKFLTINDSYFICERRHERSAILCRISSAEVDRPMFVGRQLPKEISWGRTYKTLSSEMKNEIQEWIKHV